MKHILLLFLSGLTIGTRAQGWQAMGLTSINNETSTCVGVHQGVLYASNLTGGLRKSIDQGDTWTSVPVSGIAGQIKGFTSTGSRLYMFSEDASASGYVYWSTDEGATWTADTAGMPPHAWIPGGHGNVGELHGYNGHLAMICAGGDAYFVKAETDAAWQPVPWLAANDPGSFWSVGDTLIMHGMGAQSMGFAYSPDHGQTWVTPACAGLPAWYSGAVLTHDPVSGRIYSAGGSAIQLERTLHYTEDWGATWTQVDLSSFLVVGASVWDFSHDILDLLARGDQLWVSCTNSQMNTRPDIFHSADGGLTFERDTVGLPVDPFGTYYMHDLLELDGYVFTAASLNDVFRRSLGSVGIADPATVPVIAVWPNPAADLVRVDLQGTRNVRYQLVDALGRVVRQDLLSSDGLIPLAALPAGAYTLALFGEGHLLGRQRIVKQ